MAKGVTGAGGNLGQPQSQRAHMHTHPNTHTMQAHTLTLVGSVVMTTRVVMFSGAPTAMMRVNVVLKGLKPRELAACTLKS